MRGIQWGVMVQFYRRFVASAAAMAIAAIAFPGTIGAQPAPPAIATPADGGAAMLDGLIGRSWVSPEGKVASVTRSPDGRYRIKIADDVHHVNIGMPDAPTTKSSHFGTVLMESTFQAGPNGFVLTGDGRMPHQTLIIMTPDGGLRYMILGCQKCCSYYDFVGYWEFDDVARLQAGQKPSQFKRLIGRKWTANVEARLGMPVADAHTLVGVRGGGDVRMAAAAPAPRAAGPIQSPATSARTAASPPPTPGTLAASQSPAPPLDPKAMERKFGSLAALVGTFWRVGNDEAWDIGWDRPGEGILIRLRGLYGEYETYIAPTEDGKSLRYIRRSGDFGTVEEGTMPLPARGRFWFGVRPAERTNCAVRKEQLQCGSQLLDAQRRWQATNSFVATKSDVARNAALLAALPGSFPARPAGAYHPTLGVLAEMAGKHWTVVQKASDPVSPGIYNTQLFELFGKEGGTISLVTAAVEGIGPVVLEGSEKTTLKGSVAYPATENPGRRGSHWLAVGRGGQASLCGSLPGFSSTCRTWRLSRDGTLARVVEGSKVELWRVASPVPIEANNILTRLEGRYFRADDGGILSFAGTYMQFHSSRSEWEGARGCSLIVKTKEAKCTDESPAPLTVGPSSFTIGTSSYRLMDNVFVRRTSDGREKKWTEIPHVVAKLQWRDRETEKEYRLAVADNREYRRERQAAAERNAQQWGQLLGQISSGTLLPEYMKPTTPAQWAARLPSTGHAAVGDMGGASRTAAPRMTPQQQAQFDELERFKIREQLYRGERPTTFAEDAIAKTEGQNRQAAAAPSSQGGDARRQADGGRAGGGERREARESYMYCWAVREALVLKPGGRNDRRGDVVDADGSIRIRYVSQFGKMNDADLASGENWIMVMNRMEREFLSVAPPLSPAPQLHITNAGSGGCRMGSTWDEMSRMYETDNAGWLRSNRTAPRHDVRVEPVMWAPSK